VHLTLGWRGEFDVYNFESYVEGNIKKFIPLWERYGLENGSGYNLQLIARDLHELGKLVFWGGKYPNLKPVRLFDAIEVKIGPGSLAKISNRTERVLDF
jgi:hypothetical protein